MNLFESDHGTLKACDLATLESFRETDGQLVADPSRVERMYINGDRQWEARLLRHGDLIGIRADNRVRSFVAWSGPRVVSAPKGGRCTFSGHNFVSGDKCLRCDCGATYHTGIRAETGRCLRCETAFESQVPLEFV
jgi:hypothetical protein